MTAKDLFGVIVRVIGLLLTLLGAITAVQVVCIASGPFAELMMGLDKSSLVMALGIFGVGLFLLRGGSLVSTFAYPGASSTRGRMKARERAKARGPAGIPSASPRLTR